MAVPVKIIGRYALFDEIASGGMATVYIGRLVGEEGFARTVAIKRLHPHLARAAEFVAMLVDEARLAARIRHPNVVPTLDAVKTGDELFLVMEYVHGESLYSLLRHCRRKGTVLPARYVVPIIAGVLHGLHAAHEAKGEGGQLLGIVHRDVSPQNIMVGTDGVARVFDFGIAKACGRLQVTRTGELKGKLPYMAPEQLSGQGVDRRVDVYATAVVLWEALTGERLFKGEFEAELLTKVLTGAQQPPSALVPNVPKELDAIVMRGLSRDPAQRFATAREMAYALERAVPCAMPTEVGEWVERQAGTALARRAARIDEIESLPSAVFRTQETPATSLGPYELVGELHKGYLGPIWAGRLASVQGSGELLLIRRVATQPGRAEEVASLAAAQELAAAAQASMAWRHPCLLPVIDTLQTDDELAIVSQHAEGETLRSLMWLANLRRAPMSPPVALRIAIDLLEGLEYLHGQLRAAAVGSTRLGLTSDDVIVGMDGHARLLEPGVAGVAATLEPWMRNPKRAAYDAPELLRGGGAVDLRADLFAVGVLLWEMIQNRALFTGSSLSEVADGIVNGLIEQLPPSPTVQTTSSAEALGYVVACALERDETLRYQSATEMVAAIKETRQSIASHVEVAHLVARLAQHSKLDKDSVNTAAGPYSTRSAVAAPGPVALPPPRGPGSSPGSTRLTGARPAIPSPTPPGRGVARRTTQRGLGTAMASSTGAVDLPPSSARPAAIVEMAANAAAAQTAAAEAMPTMIFNADPPTIPESTGVRRVVPPTVSDQVPSSLAALSPPEQAPRSRFVLVIIAAVAIGAVAAAFIVPRLLSGAETAPPPSAPTTTAKVVEPTATTTTGTSTAAGATTEVAPSASPTDSGTPGSTRTRGGQGSTRTPKDVPTATATAAPPTPKPPGTDELYLPKGI